MRSISRLFFLLTALALQAVPASADGPVTVTRLLKSDKTVLGQPLGYRTDAPLEIQSDIVVLAPEAQIGRHLHPVPTYGYILEGELTVYYDGGEIRVYRQGDALLEAVNTWHRGENTGSGPVRILVVSMGVAGVSASIQP